MIPIAWVESAGLGTNAADRLGVLRHTWQVVYRCPGCSTVPTERIPSRVLGMDGNPPLLPPEEIRAALARLIEAHRCATPNLAKEPPC